MIQRLGILALTAAGAALVAHWPATIRSITLWEEAALPLALAALAVALVPERHTRGTQELALVGVYLAQRAGSVALDAGLGPWWDLPLGLVVCLLPWSRRAWRTAGIWTAVAGFTAALVAPGIFGGLAEHLFIQLLFVAAMTDGLGPRDALRYTLAGLVAPRMAVPPPDVLRVDRTPPTLLRGSAWLLLGLTLSRLPLARRLAERDPWGALLDGDVLMGLNEAVRVTGLELLLVAARLLVLAGTLRLLGMPIRAPVDAPWRATDLLDWWRRTHAWRSVVFRAAFLQHLGGSGPLAIFGVFLVSGMQHAIGEPQAWGHVAVWAALGALAAANLAALRVITRRRVARWMETGVKHTPSKLGQLAATAAVVVVQGLVLGMLHHLGD